MPPEAKTEAAPPESPVVAQLEQRLKDLKEKRKVLDAHPASKEHDMAEAKRRNDQLIKEIETELKKLKKS